MEDNNMAEFEKEMETEMASLEALGSDLFGADDEKEKLEMYASDIAAIEEQASISQDLGGFAKGFPDWDIHPPKKQ